MTERCRNCDRRFDRASPGCHDVRHPNSTLADRIVEAIEHDLNDRRGLKIDTLDNDRQDLIRETWTALIVNEIKKALL